MKRVHLCSSDCYVRRAGDKNRLGFFLYITLSTAATISTSCIYDAPGDKFYRTLWTSEETLPAYETIATHKEPISGSDAEPALCGITLEFLCGGSVSIKAEGAAGSYGKYEFHGATAYFSNLSLKYGSFNRSAGYDTGGGPGSIAGDKESTIAGDNASTIIIEEAHRNGDTLLLYWHYLGSDISHITNLIRKSSYD